VSSEQKVCCLPALLPKNAAAAAGQKIKLPTKFPGSAAGVPAFGREL